jgi:hypothetical protein
MGAASGFFFSKKIVILMAFNGGFPWDFMVVFHGILWWFNRI